MIADKLFTGDDYSVHMIHEQKGDTVKPHIHTNWDESWYIISGSYEFIIGGKSIISNPGMFIYCNRNVVHSVKCLEDNSRRLAIFKDGVQIKYEN